jgi:hypothetical protein
VGAPVLIMFLSSIDVRCGSLGLDVSRGLRPSLRRHPKYPHSCFLLSCSNSQGEVSQPIKQPDDDQAPGGATCALTIVWSESTG